MKLYTYWRSTTSFRGRVALALKEIDYKTASVDLVAFDAARPETQPDAM